MQLVVQYLTQAAIKLPSAGFVVALQLIAVTSSVQLTQANYERS